MSMEDILLSEISQTYKDNIAWSNLYVNSRKKKIQTQKQSRRLLYQELEHEEKGEIFLKRKENESRTIVPRDWKEGTVGIIF